MSNADRSASGRIRVLKARTLAVYHKNNPTRNDFGGEKPSSGLTLLLRSVGTTEICDTCACEDVCDISGAFVFPFVTPDIPDIEESFSEATGQTITIPSPPDGYPEDRYAFFYFISETCNATTYTADVQYNGSTLPLQQTFLGVYDWPEGGPFPQTGILVAYPTVDYSLGGDFEWTVTASNACSSSSAPATFGCFLAGSQVAMADGTFKAIETVEVGDVVRGAFGESNPVLGLHRPLLGAGKVVNINGEHKTTAHHPHVSADKKFYCVAPDIIKGFTYGKEHLVIINKAGRTVKMLMHGLAPSRIQKLEVGINLQTLSGAKRVDTLVDIPMSPFTQVYHLVVGGSHTFVVDNYAVTGWPREDDFDYDKWESR
jgi:hypothetical protein